MKQPNLTTIGYVYLVHAIGTKRYKIGLTTREPSERLKELNSRQSAYELRLVNSVECYYPRELEKALHVKYKPFRKWGEWFELTDWKVSDVQADMSRYKYEIEKAHNHQLNRGFCMPKVNMNFIIAVLAVLTLVTHCASQYELEFTNQPGEEQAR